ncbi:MAG: hypothetical protein DRH23_00045 [Deltaproteobacteria bacterium]|nr:glycosyltransferase [Deltaproteobacteria bacterium]MBW2223233.1 glycosyltransferase [Deltaproteobacteria bacterium]MBW2402791.1 glycosyltransferase [Deltaproteobacteria bacterium]MBW2546833.1 glycosyltransferase [Deltaproteobacteria bacterium]MBW2717770.1 glycosyltransferase [Deltaproteobacteria bacterium]
MRIAYFVHGNGRGHAMRARSLVPALRTHGHDVHVHASGEAVAMLRDLGGAEVDAFLPGRQLASRFAARLATDRRLLGALRPDVIVVDGDAPSLHAAAMLRVPSVAIGHGLIFAHCRLPIALPLHHRAREALSAASASWLAHRVIVVHFGVLESFDPRVVVARPDPRPELFEGDTRPGDKLVVYAGTTDLSAYVRGLHTRGHRLVVFGRVANLPDGVVAEAPDVARFAAALRGCRGIVGTAGSNLVSEAGALGRPLLALAPGHMIEQQVNARLAERDGFAIAAAAGRIDVPAIQRFEALLERGVPRIEPPTPTVTEALSACLAELAGAV